MEKEEIIKEITNKVENVVDRYNKKLEQLRKISSYDFKCSIFEQVILFAVASILISNNYYYIAGACIAIVCAACVTPVVASPRNHATLPTPKVRGNGPMEIYMYPEEAALWAIKYCEEMKLPPPVPIPLYLLPEYAPLIYEDRYHKKGTLTDNQFITNSMLYLITQFKLKSLQT